MKYDVDEIREALGARVEELLTAHGIEFSTGGRNLRLRTCPNCRERAKRGSVKVAVDDGRFNHFGHSKRDGGGCSGDAIKLFAVLSDLSIENDFPNVLARAAAFVGISPEDLNDDELKQRRLKRQAEAAIRHAQREQERRERLDFAHKEATEHWNRLQRSNRAGEAYLKSRALESLPLVERGLVRFDSYGNVAVPLFAFDGRLVNVATRRITDGDPRAPVLKGCPIEGTLIGSATGLAKGARVYMPEGIFDSLTAAQQWPDATVLGAHSVGEIVRIAEYISPRLRDLGGSLVIVPDADDIGRLRACQACEAAIDAGLEYGTGWFTIEPGAAGHHDLNDAIRAEWRP